MNSTMGFNDTDYDISTALTPALALIEHGEGFANSWRHAEIYA